MTKINVPLSGNEEAYLVDALRSTWISSSGKYVDRFESQFADLVGTRYASSAANGTVALHLALVALGVGRGDEVIVPALTYVAVANAVKYTGARLVLVDVDPRTWCLDPAKIEASITSRTRGVIAVHNYGHPCDMDAINKIAKSFKLWVIEDAAEAHFATYNGRTAGGLADIATFSFYGNKVITSGEGGALTYNDESLHHRIRMLRSQGMDRTRCAPSSSGGRGWLRAGTRSSGPIPAACRQFLELGFNLSPLGQVCRRGSTVSQSMNPYLT